MTNYVSVRTESTFEKAIDTTVDGVFADRDEAISACVNGLIGCLEDRPDIATALLNDENHDDLREMVGKAWPDHGASLDVDYGDPFFDAPPSVLKVIGDYVRDELKGTGCYYICRCNGDPDIYHFEIFSCVRGETEMLS